MKDLDTQMEQITGKKPTKAERLRQEAQDLHKKQKAAAKREDGLASEMLAEIKKNSKRWFVAFLVVLCLWFATIGCFLFYLYQYDFSSTETTIEATQDGAGINMVGGRDVNYGAESQDDDQDQRAES